MPAGKKFAPTPEEDQFITENWGKMIVADLAAAVGVKEDTLSRYARGMLGLPCLHGANFVPQRDWTAEEDEIIRANFETPASVIRKLLPHRSRSSLRHRRYMLAKEQNVVCKPVLPPAPPRVLRLDPVKWAREDYVPCEFKEACEWMTRVHAGWKPSGDEKADWRAINARRMYGQVPVPPFVPRHLARAA